MRNIISAALAALLAGVLGGCQAPPSDSQKYANGYVPADHGFNSHKTFHSQADFYRNYRGIDGG
jgi:hypothetical protein